MPVMCSFMLICQCCFAIVKVLLKKVTYLLTQTAVVETPNLKTMTMPCNAVQLEKHSEAARFMYSYKMCTKTHSQTLSYIEQVPITHHKTLTPHLQLSTFSKVHRRHF